MSSDPNGTTQSAPRGTPGQGRGSDPGGPPRDTLASDPQCDLPCDPPCDPLSDPAIRESLLAEPDRLLEDRDLMRALIGATDAARGENVVDLRGVALSRLEARLAQLQDTHRTVIAAAYDTLAGTRMVHRAVLGLMQAESLGAFLAGLSGPVAAALRIDALRLILESAGPAGRVRRSCAASVLAPPGFVDFYAGGAAEAPGPVSLRRIDGGPPEIWGEDGAGLRSEACLRLDLGADAPPALIAMAATDPARFAPGQGTDLLAFFAKTAGLALRRHLR